MHTFFQTCGTESCLSTSVTNQLKYLKMSVSSRHSLHPHPSVLLPWEGRATITRFTSCVVSGTLLNPSELTHSAIFKHPVWVRFVEIKETRTLLALP